LTKLSKNNNLKHSWSDRLTDIIVLVIETGVEVVKIVRLTTCDFDLARLDVHWEVDQVQVTAHVQRISTSKKHITQLVI